MECEYAEYVKREKESFKECIEIIKKFTAVAEHLQENNNSTELEKYERLRIESLKKVHDICKKVPEIPVIGSDFEDNIIEHNYFMSKLILTGGARDMVYERIKTLDDNYEDKNTGEETLTKIIDYMSNIRKLIKTGKDALCVEARQLQNKFVEQCHRIPSEIKERLMYKDDD